MLNDLVTKISLYGSKIWFHYWFWSQNGPTPTTGALVRSFRSPAAGRPEQNARDAPAQSGRHTAVSQLMDEHLVWNYGFCGNSPGIQKLK